jgi:hypothetical protein
MRLPAPPLLFFALVSLSAPAWAQTPASEPPAHDPPAHVAFVDGTAVLERDGQPDSAPANMPLLAGDRVRTQAGRVEILFADGSTLHLDSNTTVDFQSDELVRLLEGRIRLTIPGPDRAVSYRIDAPSAWVTIRQPGEYRLTMTRDEVELAVLRGAAELGNDSGRTPLRAGERAFARLSVAPSYAYVFNSAAWDAFDRWSEARRDERLGASTQYLPGEVRPYAASFDRYGAWRHEPSYGYVWYPTVSVGWRPYYHGRWATLRPYGWTWIGADPWAWPTHHYGRWGFSAGAWFWIPGRSWAPAWVSWAYAPGYVSWCPLGWNNRPVVQINVNVFRGYDPWRAWTVVPRHRFGGGYVNVAVVSARAITPRVRGAFVVRDVAPDFRGYAVPRSASPIRVAGTGWRRGASPVYTNVNPGASRIDSTPSRTFDGQSRGSRAERSRSLETTGAAEAPRGRAVPRGAGESRSSITSAPETGRAGSAARDAVGAGPGAELRGSDGYGSADRTPSRRAVPRNEPAYRSTPGPGYSTPSERGNGTVERRIRPDSPGVTRAAPRTAPRYEAPRQDMPRHEVPRHEAPRYEAPRYGAPRSETPGYDAPRGELPVSRRDPGERRAPEIDRGPGGIRAVPRGARDSTPAPPAGYRSAPGGDRPAAGPDRGSPAGAGRSREGGQPSAGTAVRRPGRDR